jgi:transposase InsO family protein
MAGQHFLVVVDYTSNYPEIARLENQTASCTIKHMKAIIARHGIPKTVCTDNGPQFDCREFRLFAKDYGFQHDTSSPHYAQSNGKAESAVKIVKRLISKAKQSGEDPYMALLNY